MAVDLTTGREQIAEIYIAAFGRVSEPAGLAYWTDLYVNKGVTLASIATGFTTTAEYIGKYPTFMTNTEYVSAIYTNVFGRAADDAGLKFWVATLDNKQLTRGTIMQTMLDSAHANGSADGTRLTNLGNFCLLYTSPSPRDRTRSRMPSSA